MVPGHVGHLALSLFILLCFILFLILLYPRAGVVSVPFVLPLVDFMAVVAVFLFAPGLILFLGLAGHILFCLLLGGDKQQLMIDLLVGEVLLCGEVVFDVLHRGGDFF